MRSMRKLSAPAETKRGIRGKRIFHFIRLFVELIFINIYFFKYKYSIFIDYVKYILNFSFIVNMFTVEYIFSIIRVSNT